jgi:hypothetical protein
MGYRCNCPAPTPKPFAFIHYSGPDYYLFNRGSVHFIRLNSVDISGTTGTPHYGHVDS